MPETAWVEYHVLLPKGKRTNGYLVGTAEVLVQA